jgi:crotonobetainyl-CoA:carnitine CoA-transferase CaiB-like acyl-CoA transferase
MTDDRSAYFCSVNWGKKSIAVNLSTTEGKRIVHKLVAKSDIVIASYKPGDAEKLGVSYTQLKTINQQLIYGLITGYGSDNDRVGYDAVIQAESGFVDLNGEKNGEPLKMPVALIDILAAHHLKEGLLLALLTRERTGKGSCIEVSLLQAAISSLANQATNWLVANKLPVRQGSSHPNIAPYGESFITRDGKRILLAVGSDRQFFDLLEIVGLASMDRLAMFMTNPLRVKNRELLTELLAEAIRNYDAAILMSEINAKKIPAGIIQNIKEVFEMQAAKDLLLKSSDLMGVRNYVGMHSDQISFTNTLTPPPHFGEHTDEIINQLGQ